MVCRKCGLKKSPTEFYDGKYTCKTCLAAYFRWYYRTHVAPQRREAAGRFDPEAPDPETGLARTAPPPASIYLTQEAVHHARCEQPLGLIGYRPSAEELHFRCNPCGESIFLPTIAVERLARR
jgi:hypothetical protein